MKAACGKERAKGGGIGKVNIRALSSRSVYSLCLSNVKIVAGNRSDPAVAAENR